MAHFERCRGKTLCIETAAGCVTCGRSQHEISMLRSLIDQAAGFALAQDYDNAAEFAAYLAEKIAKKVDPVRAQGCQTAAD